MKKAKVLSVYDEGALEDTPFIGATGFSVLVEVDGQRTLFDTGMRGRYLIHNLDYLDVKPDMIDRVVISHNHKGNMGGFSSIVPAMVVRIASPFTWVFGNCPFTTTSFRSCVSSFIWMVRFCPALIYKVW